MEGGEVPMVLVIVTQIKLCMSEAPVEYERCPGLGLEDPNGILSL